MIVSDSKVDYVNNVKMQKKVKIYYFKYICEEIYYERMFQGCFYYSLQSFSYNLYIVIFDLISIMSDKISERCLRVRNYKFVMFKLYQFIKLL